MGRPNIAKILPGNALRLIKPHEFPFFCKYFTVVAGAVDLQTSAFNPQAHGCHAKASLFSHIF
jgi:hypothetical protein